MKVFARSAFALSLLLCGFARAHASVTVEAVLSAPNAVELEKILREERKQNQRARACALQRKLKLVPTACYVDRGSPSSRTADANSDLDRECLKRARSAEVLPAADEFTSTTCQRALIERARDLEYARR